MDTIRTELIDQPTRTGMFWGAVNTDARGSTFMDIQGNVINNVYHSYYSRKRGLDLDFRFFLVFVFFSFFLFRFFLFLVFPLSRFFLSLSFCSPSFFSLS